WLSLPHRPPPLSTLFPYTTLFRSRPRRDLGGPDDVEDQDQDGDEVEDAMREDGSDERRPEAAPARQLPRQHGHACQLADPARQQDRKSTRLNSSHQIISYAVFCLK